MFILAKIYIRKPVGPFGSLDGKHRFSGNLEKIFKTLHREISKMQEFGIFFMIFNKPCVAISGVWTNYTMSSEILRNLRRFSQDFLMKLRKICYFFIFFKEPKEFWVTFAQIYRKNIFDKINEKNRVLTNF